MPSDHSAGAPAGASVDFEKVGSDYFQQRELKKGAAGWVLQEVSQSGWLWRV